MSISGKIEEYKAKITDRWHTPGHKGALWEDDITEIDGSAVFPADALIEAEKKTAMFYGAKTLKFLTGGSSMGVKAAILAVGGDIITFSGAHQSVYEGAQLNKVKVTTIETGEENGLFKRPSLKNIEDACRQNKDAKAVVITSPDYFGRAVEIEAAEIVRGYGKILIADSAHGAHFPLVDGLKEKSFSGIADFCNLSAHKTLFAMTMGAYLCINNDSLRNAALTALKNLGTTSPLYPLLASLEVAPVAAALNKKRYGEIRERAAEISKIVPLLENDDFTRIVVDCSAMNLSGKELFDILFAQKIAAEMYHGRYLVFIATHTDDDSKFYRLLAALKEVRINKT